MKVLFLDFDGVLNSQVFFRALGNRYPPGELDRGAVARLAAIVERTGAKVVVSSTWRLGYSLEQLRAILVAHGFHGDVIGVTPSLGHTASLLSLAPRGEEIQAWIDAQPQRPARFAILDDTDDMAHLMAALIKTEFETGLLDAHVEAVVRLLGPRAGG